MSEHPIQGLMTTAMQSINKDWTTTQTSLSSLRSSRQANSQVICFCC